MNTMRSLRAIALAGSCLLPIAAAADDFDVGDAPATPAQLAPPTHNAISQLPLPALGALPGGFQNEVVLGGGYQSNTALRYGRFNGLSNGGFFGIGGFTLRSGFKWDSEDSFYLQAQGTDLGLDSRSFSLKLGQQGIWGLNFAYDGIPDFYSNSFHSLWGSDGTLKAGIMPGSINNLTAQIGSSLPVQDISTRRDIFSGGGKYQVGDWTVSSQLRHEHKEGVKENSLAILSAPSPIAANGNLTSSGLGYFPEPINYDTDRYDISAQYNGGRMQGMVGYTYNKFTDNAATWNGVNPFLFTGTANVTGASGTAGAGSALLSSRYSLPPSNSAHQAKGQFAYNITPTMRLNANMQYGLMLQDDPYVSTTGNTFLAALPLPKSSLDGAIQTVHANVALTARPLDKTDVRIAYTIDDRESLTQRNRYNQWYLDAQNKQYTAYNMPLNYRHQTFEAQVNYKVAPETKVTLGYAYDSTARNDSATKLVSQSTFNAKVRTALWTDAYGSVSVMHEDRKASNYRRNAAWDALGLVENDLFGMMNYYEASRTREEVKVMADFAPMKNMSASLFGKADFDRYPDSAFGLKSNNNFTIGPDINYQFSTAMSAHAFYNYQLLYFNQNSALSNACNSNGTSLTAGPAPCQNIGWWQGKNLDSTHSIGLGLDWQAIPDTLKVSADYNWSVGRNSYSIMDGGIFSFVTAGTAALQLAPIPDVRSIMHAINLRAEYKLADNASLWFGYTFERFSYKDYGTQVGATQFSNAAFSGDSNASYNVHIVMGALRLRW